MIGDSDELMQVMQNLDGERHQICRLPASASTLPLPLPRLGEVEASVADYGPGIASEHIPRLTERFYRVNVQESRSLGGTGLGLAIVKHILNRHRGKLMISSELGKGSRFTIQLPAAPVGGGTAAPVVKLKSRAISAT